MTEYGFETNPPDPFSGIAPDLQAKYNTLGEYIAYQNPRILSQAQFLLVDVAPVRTRTKNTKAYWFTYQSGLYTNKLAPKLAAYSYQFPFLVIPIGIDSVTGAAAVHIWGQLRFLPNGAASEVLDPVEAEGQLGRLGDGRRPGADVSPRRATSRPTASRRSRHPATSARSGCSPTAASACSPQARTAAE